MNDVAKNTLLRILSAVVALPVYVFAIITDIFQSIPILIVSMIISITCLVEFYRITEKIDEGETFFKTGIITGIIANIMMYMFAYSDVYGYSRYIKGFDGRVAFGLLAVLISFVFILQLSKNKIKGATNSIAITVFGVVFLVFSFSHIILLKALNHGLYYIILLNIVVMLNDTGAYFGGISFGKHKTGFAVSPNKSWEGYFSGLMLSVIASVMVNEIFIHYFDVNLFGTLEATFVGILISILANVGDLCESLIKRDGDVKDSSSIIPGHGGMWDVFDALIFAMPVFYYYLILSGVH